MTIVRLVRHPMADHVRMHQSCHSWSAKWQSIVHILWLQFDFESHDLVFRAVAVVTDYWSDLLVAGRDILGLLRYQ